MQFKHPEILFALFLLIIPIIVHLFQLRRFQKVPFTNVKFLKQVQIQTRKSSRLKKFLTLCARLLALTGLVFAFAQPFLSSVKKDEVRNTYIYLDNSLSMQAKGSQGELFKRAVQDVIKNFENTSNVNLVTNNNFFKNLSGQDLKRELLNLDYYPIVEDFNNILFKIENDIANKVKGVNEIIVVSDFQNTREIKYDTLNRYVLVQLQPNRTANISIDSVYISNQNSESIALGVVLQSFNDGFENVPISLYEGNVLQGKSNLSFEENQSKTAEFVIRNTGSFNGRLVVDDPGLQFDNELFFAINEQEKVNVLSVGEGHEYLAKIYTNDEFNFKETSIDQLDYSQLNNQDLIILNELENIPNALVNSLSEFSTKGGSLVIVPNVNSDNSSYSALYSALRLGSFGAKTENRLAITKINFTHPVLKNVFEKQIENFQYPTVNSYFNSNLRNSTAVLTFENETAFISQIASRNGTVYTLAAALSGQNSNFKNSPLIVPIFYNFGRLSYKHSELNYTIGRSNDIDIKLSLQKDDILQISNQNSSFIPLQQIGNSTVKISLTDQPIESGFYQLKDKERLVKQLAFNYNRNESNLIYNDAKTFADNQDNVSYFSNVQTALNTVSNEYKTNSLWQLFLALALLFLMVEIVLLKFLKP